MDVEKRWSFTKISDGVGEIRLSSWRHFHDYVIEEMLDFSHYVWRGQRDAAWPLRSSLDRMLDTHAASNRRLRAKQHLESFQRAARGRRGSNPPLLSDENEWWALGQHNALATPLLDWTESPFVALYFAFEKKEAPADGYRAVWALTDPTDENKKAADGTPDGAVARTLTLVRPNQSENPRLLSQAGLFTRAPAGQSVDEWIRKYSPGNDSGMTLMRLSIPEEGRKECLRTLNRMNINHATLFPDLYGAGAHCNRNLELE